MLKRFSSKLRLWLTVFVSLLYLWVGPIGQNGGVLCFEPDGHVVLEHAINYASSRCCNKNDKTDDATSAQPTRQAACKHWVDVPMRQSMITQTHHYGPAAVHSPDSQTRAVMAEPIKNPGGFLAQTTMLMLAKPPLVNPPRLRPKPHLGFLKTIRLLF